MTLDEARKILGPSASSLSDQELEKVLKTMREVSRAIISDLKALSSLEAELPT